MLFSIAVHTISSISKFDPLLCDIQTVTKVKDLIYVVCFFHTVHATMIIRAHEDRIPHDLIMITVAEKIVWPFDMVGVDSTNTLYVRDFEYDCIWKIDMTNDKADIWLSQIGRDNILASSQ